MMRPRFLLLHSWIDDLSITKIAAISLVLRGSICDLLFVHLGGAIVCIVWKSSS